MQIIKFLDKIDSVIEHLFEERSVIVEEKAWVIPAFNAATDAAMPSGRQRMRWAKQNEWDLENIRTESTRFPVEMDRKLRKYCREAHVTRCRLINYMLRAWMATWEVVRDET